MWRALAAVSTVFLSGRMSHTIGPRSGMMQFSLELTAIGFTNTGPLENADVIVVFFMINWGKEIEENRAATKWQRPLDVSNPMGEVR